jgi:DNA-binding NarL/FixJ family response regulator
VLIVDDHDALRRGIRALVETRTSFVVVGEAASGYAALEEARRTAPDIAIIDYSLPELNGLDLTFALKRELPRLEILIYTMHSRDEIISGILKAGARAYVMKSDSEDHLLAALDALAVRRPYFSGAVSEALLEQFLQSHRHINSGLLTHREREVVQLIAEGKINKQIASTLDISIKTVETHRASAMRKLNLRTTADLVRYAVRNSLIEP